MIAILQILVIAVALSLLLVGLGRRRTHAGKAWKKIALLLLVVAMIVAVLFPDSTNRLAHVFGIGRGADLLLYVLTMAFIVFALNNYLHGQDQRDTLFRLARRVALDEAYERYKIRRK